LQARKRAEVEARLQEKLKAEDQLLKRTSTLAEDLKTQLNLAYKISMEIHSTDSMVRLRKAQKRRLASFLVTPSESANYDAGQARKLAADERVVAGDVASCIAPLPLRPKSDIPVYFLPKKMLPKQENRLDDQEDRTDAAIEAADQAREERRATMQDDLAQIKDKIKKIQQKMQDSEDKVTDDIKMEE
jgi:gas vesicle protein